MSSQTFGQLRATKSAEKNEREAGAMGGTSVDRHASTKLAQTPLACGDIVKRHPQFADALASFAAYLANERRVSEATCVAYRSDLQLIFAAALARKRTTLASLDDTFLRDTLASLTERNGRPLSPRSIGRKQSALRVFFGWCSTRYDSTLKDPTPYLISPLQPRKLPRPLEVPAALAMMQGRIEADEPQSCSPADSEAGAADNIGALGGVRAEGRRAKVSEHRLYVEARDIAALLLMYGPGLRRQEVLELKLDDVDLERRWLAVQARSASRRVVPIPTGCIEGLRAYLALRPVGLNPYFLAGRNAQPLSARTLGQLVSRAAVLLMGRHATPHQLRHSFATHLLEHGASLHHIKRLLGHNQLATTMRYREVAKDQLANAHRLAHPRARLLPPSRS